MRKGTKSKGTTHWLIQTRVDKLLYTCENALRGYLRSRDVVLETKTSPRHWLRLGYISRAEMLYSSQSLDCLDSDLSRPGCVFSWTRLTVFVSLASRSCDLLTEWALTDIENISNGKSTVWSDSSIKNTEWALFHSDWSQLNWTGLDSYGWWYTTKMSNLTGHLVFWVFRFSFLTSEDICHKGKTVSLPSN